MLPQSLLNSDDDWIETTRHKLYPRLHDPLVQLGDSIGVPLYSIGTVRENQYVGVLHEAENVIEDELDDVGRRNPIAALKRYEGQTSEGSWVVVHDDAAELVEDGMQLHVTLFDHPDGRVIYAHYEDDWRTRPLAHLREKHFDAETGVEKATVLFDDETFLTLHNTDD